VEGPLDPQPATWRARGHRFARRRVAGRAGPVHGRLSGWATRPV